MTRVLKGPASTDGVFLRVLITVLLAASGLPQAGASTDKVEIVDAGYHTQIARVWRYPGDGDGVTDIALDGAGSLYFGTAGNAVHKTPTEGPQFSDVNGELQVLDTRPEWPRHFDSTVFRIEIAWPEALFVRLINDETHSMAPDGEILGTLESEHGMAQHYTVDDQGGFYEVIWSGNDIVKIADSAEPIWVYEPFTQRVTAIEVDNEGFIYAASDGELHKIDANTGERMWRYTGHGDWVRGIDVAPDGSVVSAGDDRTVQKISRTGERVWSYKGHNRNVSAVAVGHDGYIYSGGYDETVHKISPDGENVWTYIEHDRNVRALAVDQEGAVYTGSSDGEVHKLRELREDER